MSSSENISYLPSDGLTYDPAEPLYWDKEALDKEMTRAIEICHGCRMCFKFCDAFPNLFKAIDDRDGDVRKLEKSHKDQVVDECFQCKLCEVQCPYTPRDKHEFQLDFPKLLHRYKAIRTKDQGLKLRDRILGNPDASAKAARASLGLANVMNRVSAHRWFLEKVLGIHRDKQLPDFASQTFETWAERQGLCDVGGDVEVVIFQTCYVQNNEPEIGKDTVDVYRKSQVKLACAKGLACCGMPAWESGDLDGLRANAKKNLDILTPYVEKGAKVVGLNPTCTMVMRREYPELLEEGDRERAQKLADAMMDPSEYLWTLRKEPRFNKDFKSSPGEKVAYHAPCHLRAQAKGFKGRDMLKQIPGVKPVLAMECCGHDGTYAMKVEGFEPSQRIGKKAFDAMGEATAEVWSTDCPLAAIQFEQHAGVKPMHPMTILARAYREDGFTKRLLPPSEQGESK